MRLGLIAAREQRQWSQQRVADMIGKDRTAVTRYELGDCDIPGKVLKQLADLFDVPMHVLLANTEDKVVDYV